jgi:GMP synthase (glutamine-hydrolysing)
MKTAVALRHIAFEDPGSLEDILTKAGYRLHLLEAGQDAIEGTLLQDPDLLIVLGGPISANDREDYPFLNENIVMLEQRLHSGKPTLGICLGAQLIAVALGSRIHPMPEKEIGWSPIELTEAGQHSCLRHLDNTPVLHWHGEAFELPRNANRLASTPLCPQQAFSIGNTILGLQFHIEVTASVLERWYIGHTLELAQAGISIPQLRRDSQTHAPVLKSKATTCINEWLASL